MPHGLTYGNEMRPGSVPIQSGTEGHDDKRRKGSAVTATNDKELREMLARNEGRLLKDVAQEVTAKERTPMAEKTKQLFAMLWWVPCNSRAWSLLISPGFVLCANLPKPRYRATESTHSTQVAVVLKEWYHSIRPPSESSSGLFSLAFRPDD